MRFGNFFARLNFFHTYLSGVFRGVRHRYLPGKLVRHHKALPAVQRLEGGEYALEGGPQEGRVDGPEHALDVRVDHNVRDLLGLPLQRPVPGEGREGVLGEAVLGHEERAELGELGAVELGHRPENDPHLPGELVGTPLGGGKNLVVAGYGVNRYFECF